MAGYNLNALLQGGMDLAKAFGQQSPDDYITTQTKLGQRDLMVGKARQEQMKFQAMHEAAQAARAMGQDPNLVTLMMAGLDPRQISGYTGDNQEQRFRGAAVDAARAGNWNDANASLMGVANGPIALATVEGQNLINNRLMQGGGGVSTTEQGRAGIAADAARARASDASAANSYAGVKSQLGRLAIAQDQHNREVAGTWDPSGKASSSGGAASKATEGERNAAGFYERMRAASGELKGLEGSGYDPTNLRDFLTTGSSIGNFAASPQGQQYHQAAMNWVRANLRKESGAAIGVDEAKQEIRNYFPQPGDSPQVIAQKARNRQVTEDAMRQAGGRAIQPAQPNAMNALQGWGIQKVP